MIAKPTNELTAELRRPGPQQRNHSWQSTTFLPCCPSSVSQRFVVFLLYFLVAYPMLALHFRLKQKHEIMRQGDDVGL